jgi:deazaflavin-dependent oxidoreductase (nitroreductase family)
VSDWNAQIIEEFRSHEGKVAGYFEGATMLLLHTEGRRTGTEYVNPLVYLPDEGRWVVVASKGGAPFDPDWLKNLEANPEATIEVGTERIPVRATKILREGEEREALYARQVERRPGFADYLEKTKGIRSIPVVVLERR